MIIGIDGNEANHKKRVGSNQYAAEVLKAIAKTNKRHKWRIFLSDKPMSHMPMESRSWKYCVLPGPKPWIIRTLTPKLLFNSYKLDAFFSPTHYTPPVSRVPLICAVMDLEFLNNPGYLTRRDFWQLKYWTAWSVFVSKYIIAISESTKSQIHKYYPYAFRKVVVTPLGYDKKQFNSQISQSSIRRARDKYKVGSDYLLYLGTLKPNKNIEGIIRAFSTTKSKYEGVKLVIAGKKGWLYEPIFKLVKNEGLTQRVVFTGFIDEEDKPGLVAGAKVLVAPSFWEGFGLHVLESMAIGTPVIVSDKGNLPELVGDAGIVVNPASDEEIAQGMDKILSMSAADYSKIKRRSMAQAKKFSWEQTAKQTITTIERLQK